VSDEEAPPRYRFGPLERRGLVAGWRGGQIAVVAVALVVAVGILRARPSAAGVAAAFVSVAAGVVTATWPVAGRTAEQWAPEAARHIDTLRRRHKMRRREPFATLRVLAVDVTPTAAAPGALFPARPEQRPGVGVMHDVAAQTYTAVLDVSGPGFVLLGAADKTRRVSDWSGVLASLAREGTAVHRLQWIERSLPDDGAEVRRHITDRARLDVASAARRSYAALVDSEVADVHRHQVMLAVTVHAGRSARAVRGAGGGQRGACAVVLREAASLSRRLGEAGLDVAGVLSPPALNDAVRRGFDVETAGRQLPERQSMPTSETMPIRPVSSQPTWPGPMAMVPEWGRLRADATWHATYWIAEWPRTDVGADFLGPLLLVSDIRRSVAVVMEPVAPLRAARRIEQARTADIADAELRRRGGFLATARRRREEEVLVQREGELADGHASFRFSGYVTVSARDTDALEAACGRMEQVAGQAGLELRRCYGDQAMAFTCTLPLGRGLV
jgi:hypothetical protein